MLEFNFQVLKKIGVFMQQFVQISVAFDVPACILLSDRIPEGLSNVDVSLSFDFLLNDIHVCALSVFYA